MDTTGNEKIVVNYEEKDKNNLAFSIARYLEFVFQINRLMDTQRKTIQILLVEIDEHWNPDEFIKSLSEYGHIDGILFLTMEEFPRGDWPKSNLNKSRMIREMLENSYNAVTANYLNLIPKACQLVSRVIKNNNAQRKLSEVSDEFGKLQEKIVSELYRQKNLVQFDQNIEIDKYNEKEPLDFLSRYYLLGGIHSSTLGHANLRELFNNLENGDNENNSPGNESQKDTTMEVTKSVKIADSWKKVKLLETLYDLAFIAASHPLRFIPFKILIIDDNPRIVIKNFNKRRIIDYFPSGTKVYITNAGEWKKFLLLHDHSAWENMYSKKAKLSLTELSSNFKSPKQIKNKNLFEKVRGKKYIKFIFDFIVVDLLLGDYNEGNQIINNLVNFRHIFNRQCQEKERRTYFDIIVLSLSEEAHDISRALNEGSLNYVHKSRPYMLPAVIAQLEKGREILEQRDRDKERPQKARIFGKLYRLPEILKRRLKTEPFLDLPGKEVYGKEWNIEDDKFIQNLNDYIKIPAYEWIKNMPKANLHFHLGGSIPLDSVFFLSLNMLKNIPDETLEKSFSKIKEFILEILDGDWNNIWHLFKIMKPVHSILVRFDSENFYSNALAIKKILGEERNKMPKSKIITWLKSIKDKSCGYFDKYRTSREQPGKKKIEEIFFSILEHIIKQCDNDKSIPSFQAVNMFNVLIGILEGKDEDDIVEFWKRLKILKSLEIDFETVSQKAIIRNCFLGLDIEKIDGISKKSKKTLNDIKKNIPKQGKDILNHFVSAKVRETTSLVEYLAGNKFIGAEQLQKKENIMAALYLIIKRNIEDNVRYLEIRLSPDGYTESKDLTMQEAINALLEYTDLITCYFYQRGKFIRVNYILCVKRHKPPDQAAIEISAAITNRERERKFKKILPPITENNIHSLKYQWKPSRVVGVDLAGKEKDNPARKFVNDFFPLFKTNFFITVHAGEEDTARSIWEAIYLLHANRIGHGLTLKDYQYLTELFRDLQICIEMNPISNLLTNPDIENEYPFYDFVANGIKVTINTDNQSISESILSEEYLMAAELYQNHRNNKNRNWISKWDMLRVIKNGFSGAFLDREEKRNLMRAIEEEIYQEIIEEYGL